MQNSYLNDLPKLLPFLSVRLSASSDVLDLKRSLCKCELFATSVSLKRANCFMDLQKARYQYLHPKDKDLTDMDRKILLEASTSDLQHSYDTLVALEDALARRIDILKVLLSST